MPRSFNLLVLALDAIHAHQPDLQGGGTAFRYVTQLPHTISRLQSILVFAHLLVQPSLKQRCPTEVERLFDRAPKSLVPALRAARPTFDHNTDKHFWRIIPPARVFSSIQQVTDEFRHMAGRFPGYAPMIRHVYNKITTSDILVQETLKSMEVALSAVLRKQQPNMEGYFPLSEHDLYQLAEWLKEATNKIRSKMTGTWAVLEEGEDVFSLLPQVYPIFFHPNDSSPYEQLAFCMEPGDEATHQKARKAAEAQKKKKADEKKEKAAKKKAEAKDAESPKGVADNDNMVTFVIKTCLGPRPYTHHGDTTSQCIAVMSDGGKYAAH